MDETAGQKSRKRHWVKAVGIFVALLVVGFGIGLWLAPSSRQTPALPSAITAKITFPVFLPNKLPDHFTIEQNSFTLDEDTLVFTARDNAGQIITFSEQRKQADFDFSKFYQEYMKDARAVENTPFPTMAGRSPAQQNAEVVSVITDETWIIIYSNTVASGQLHDIARSLKKD